MDKKSMYALLALVSLSIVLAVNVDESKPWHTLQQTAKSSIDKTSIDSDGDGLIDQFSVNNITTFIVNNYNNNSIIIINSSAGKYSAIDFYRAGVALWGLGLNPSNDFYIDEYGIANRFTIKQGGNVGIGTATPNSKLNIDNGVLKISPTTVATVISTTGGLGLELFSYSGGAYPGGYMLSYDRSTGSYKDLYLRGNTITIDNPTAGGSGLYINGSNNVGIGTTSPSEKLDVAGKIKGTELCIGNDCRNVWPSGGGGGGGSGLGDWTVLSVDTTYQATTDGFVVMDADMAAAGSDNLCALIGITDNNANPTTERLFSGSRRIGGVNYDVGDSSSMPVKKNDYWKVAQYPGNSGSCDFKVFWIPLSGSGAGGDNLGNHTAAQNIKLNGNWLSGDGGNEGVYVDNSGKVGIGTTNPQGLLHLTAQNDETNPIFRIERGNGGRIWGIHENNNYFNIRDITAGADRVSIDTSGGISATGDICTNVNGGKCLSTAGALPYYVNRGRQWQTTYSFGGDTIYAYLDVYQDYYKLSMNIWCSHGFGWWGYTETTTSACAPPMGKLVQSDPANTHQVCITNGQLRIYSDAAVSASVGVNL